MIACFASKFSSRSQGGKLAQNACEEEMIASNEMCRLKLMYQFCEYKRALYAHSNLSTTTTKERGESARRCIAETLRALADGGVCVCVLSAEFVRLIKNIYGHLFEPVLAICLLNARATKI